MDILDVVYATLERVREPLHFRDIATRVMAWGDWQSEADQPELVIEAKLAEDIRQGAASSRFHRFDHGVYGLRSWLRYASPALSVERCRESTPPSSSTLSWLRRIESAPPPANTGNTTGHSSNFTIPGVSPQLLAGIKALYLTYPGATVFHEHIVSAAVMNGYTGKRGTRPERMLQHLTDAAKTPGGFVVRIGNEWLRLVMSKDGLHFRLRPTAKPSERVSSPSQGKTNHKAGQRNQSSRQQSARRKPSRSASTSAQSGAAKRDKPKSAPWLVAPGPVSGIVETVLVEEGSRLYCEEIAAIAERKGLITPTQKRSVADQVVLAVYLDCKHPLANEKSSRFTVYPDGRVGLR